MDFLQHTFFFKNSLIDWSYFLLALLVTIFASTWLSLLIIRILRKVTKRIRNTRSNIFVKTIDHPLRLAIKVIGFYASFSLIVLPPNIENIIHNLLSSLLVFSLYWAVHGAVDIIVASFSKITDKIGKKPNDEVINFFTKAIKALVFFVGLMSILQEWNINVTGFLASLGLGGLAFALAAKDTAANLFGSLVIFIDKPFSVDDWIKTPEVEGTIVEIGIRSTKVRTFAQAIVTVPNANLANAAIINWSRMGKRRIKTTLGLNYNTTPEQMKSILADLKSYLIKHPEIDDETIYINFSGFGASTLDIFCYFFTKTTNWGAYMSIQEEVFLEFMHIITQTHQAHFAFPSQSLYLEKGSLN